VAVYSSEEEDARKSNGGKLHLGLRISEISFNPSLAAPFNHALSSSYTSRSPTNSPWPSTHSPRCAHSHPLSTVATLLARVMRSISRQIPVTDEFCHLVTYVARHAVEGCVKTANGRTTDDFVALGNLDAQWIYPSLNHNRRWVIQIGLPVLGYQSKP
jgi:hypothetical protein